METIALSSILRFSIGHYCAQRGWKRNVCALPRTEMHFCKSWFAPSKLYLYHNFDEIYPSRYPSQRNATLHCSDICFHMILYDIILFGIKTVTSLSSFALEKQQGKIVVFSH